jgi:hypothetical protein
MRGLWIGVLASLVAGPALAAQQALSDEQIEAMAAWIIDAEVTSVETRWAASGRGAIETVAWLAVERVHKGEPVETLAVVLEGGRLGDEGNWAPDEARLLEDVRYELTLAHDDRGRLRVLGGELGAVALDPLPCYALTGADWTHNANPVGEDFSLNVSSFGDGMVSDAALEEAYVESLTIWNVDGEAGVYLPYGGHTNDSNYGGNSNVNVAMYSNSTWGSTLAMAMYSWTGNGNLTDCDIEFYGSNGSGSIQWSFDVDNGASGGQMDFAIVAIHELGHCLGLDHTNTNGAIMYPSTSPGTSPADRHLHSDDKAGLQQIYGPASVQVVVDDHWFEVAEGPDDGDDALDPGETVELHVVLRNQGSAMAGDVQGLLGSSADGVIATPHSMVLGDMAPGADTGSAADELLFSLTTTGACGGNGTASLTVDIDDAVGNQWTSDAMALDYECGGGGGDDDDDRPGPPGLDLVEPQGCQCAEAGTGQVSVVAVAALFLGLAAHRRRVT